MNSVVSPCAALATPLVWVVRDGPDCGQVFPASSGVLGRLSGFADPQMSRRSLRVEPRGKNLQTLPCGGTNPVYKMWKTLPLRRRLRKITRVRPGTRLLLGQTQLQLRRRPLNLRLTPPRTPQRLGVRWLLFLVLPLIFMISMGALLKWRALFLVVILGILGCIILYRRARLVPTPAQLWLAAGTPQIRPDKPPAEIRVYNQRRLRRQTLTIAPGENLCIRGSAAASYAAWIVAQALLYGQGHLSGHNLAPWCAQNTTAKSGETGLEIRIVDAGNTPASSPSQVTICLSDTPPHWAHRIIDAPRLRCPVSRNWFVSLVAALESNPAAIELSAQAPLETLPESVSAPVCDADEQRRLAANWAHPQAGLTCVLGMLPGGETWEVDLTAEGPHALVAGTTGSGKSELLTTWMLNLAKNYSPLQLQFVFMDYKGGAAFAPLQALPHTHGVLSDLDPGLTARALHSLEAFLKLREAQFAAVGARDISHYCQVTKKPLARVLIVVDEFRALATEHSDILENLVRLATHGRSLGLHLILATQKPGGVVNSQILANTNLRIALRVRTEMDSLEVLSDARAAHLPAIPGRLCWEGNTAGSAQAMWCGGQEAVEKVVANIAKAWLLTHPAAELETLWLPPLPESVAAPPGAMALCDKPREAAQEWRLPEQSFGIFGNPGTGRTTALATLAAAWMSQCRGVVVFSPTPQAFQELASVENSRLQLLSADNLWELEWLVEGRADLTNCALIVDRADILADSLEKLYPANGTKQLERLISQAGGARYRVALSGPLSSGRTSWGSLLPIRLALCPRDVIDLHSAGIEGGAHVGSLRDYLPDNPVPGRGVWQQANRLTEVQVGLPPRAEEAACAAALSSLTECASVTTPARSLGVGAPATARNATAALGDLRGNSQLLPRLRSSFSRSDLPSPADSVVAGWSAIRGDWLRRAPQGNWMVSDTPQLRPLVAQLKREYRRLGYEIMESFTELEKSNICKKVLFIYRNEYKPPSLGVDWEEQYKNLGFDITILNLVSPGNLPLDFTYPASSLYIYETVIFPTATGLEGRMRLATALNTTPEIIRKAQVATDFPAIYKDELGVSTLQFPRVSVSHLT